ncbi:MAG: thioredoxin family protein [Alkalispirochaeta sp.]
MDATNTDAASLEARLFKSDSPTIVEFWAPWCVPCRQMEPILEELSEAYRGSVETVRINADEHPELATRLKIYTIPTVLLVQGGAERARRSGVQSRSDLNEMYVAARDGGVVAALSNRSRFFRIAIAVAIGMMAQEFTVQWPFFLAAGAIFFSAIHDRCPLWQAVKRMVPSFRS